MTYRKIKSFIVHWRDECYIWQTPSLEGRRVRCINKFYFLWEEMQRTFSIILLQHLSTFVKLLPTSLFPLKSSSSCSHHRIHYKFWSFLYSFKCHFRMSSVHIIIMCSIFTLFFVCHQFLRVLFKLNQIHVLPSTNIHALQRQSTYSFCFILQSIFYF